MKPIPASLCLALLLSVPANGEDFVRRHYDTARVPAGALHIDGHLSEPAWETVPWSGGFLGHSPTRGAAPARETQVRILYDDEAIYFAFRAWDDPELIENRLGRQDQFPGDWVEVNIDSRQDLRTAYSFTLSVSGVKGDEAISEDGDNWDGNWNPVWFAGTAIDSLGWTAEIKIPFSQLRFPEKEEHVWGLQMTRRIQREEERSTWQPMPLNAPGWVSYFGEIHGIHGIRPGGQLELAPYVLARNNYTGVQGTRFGPADPTRAIGLDGKWAPGNNLALNFTLNPDFGQVEADPSEINLSGFESFFSEKRPFFVAGRENFDWRLSRATAGGGFNSDNLFYSRRIGRAPHSAWWLATSDTEELVDAPGASTILGALKLTAKSAEGWTLGLIESVTDEEHGTLRDSDTGAERQLVLEPRSHYGVLRVERELDRGRTVVGGILTATNRRLSEDHLRASLHQSAWSGGLNLQHYLGEDRLYYVETRLAGSLVTGDPRAITATQTAPAHLFQRPDADHLELDTTRTSLAGLSIYGHVGRTRSRDPLAWQTGLSLRTPGFETNDIGYLRAADQAVQFGWVGWAERTPGPWWLDWQLNGNEWLTFDSQGELLREQLNLNGNLRFNSRRQIGGSVDLESEYKDPTLLRGGPRFTVPGAITVDLWHNSPDQGRVGYSFGGNLAQGNDNYAVVRDLWADVWWKPWNQLGLSLNPSWNMERNTLQYIRVQDVDDLPDRPWLLGSLVRRTFVVTGRAEYYPHPGLTLQLYNEVFMTQGHYGSFRKVTDSGASALDDRTRPLGAGEISQDPDTGDYDVREILGPSYGFSDPDFDALGFNSNLVFRWDWSPGSQLYLVWTRSAWDGLGRHGFVPLRNLSDPGVIASDQVFLIKISRWLDI
ncbi:MAG: carbohydrate binding family 9 domain-containing protein [Candidatus Cloacimonetes bacterium]|nr:carbohydrate binding family 9 domain-containing protein [Candidatus Cloacimonadota bacterium]